tara:strand:- start:53 stop:484 length:432 start_codon:yes stop_codon:yes gene_type:complete
MAITITWSVKDMHKVTETGAVYRVDWQCSGIDEDTKTTHSISGQYMHKKTFTESYTIEGSSTTLKEGDSTKNVIPDVTTTQNVTKRAMPDHTASGFKAYADLTESDVLVWVKADGEGSRVEALITKSINNKIANSANSNGLPW